MARIGHCHRFWHDMYDLPHQFWSLLSSFAQVPASHSATSRLERKMFVGCKNGLEDLALWKTRYFTVTWVPMPLLEPKSPSTWILTRFLKVPTVLVYPKNSTTPSSWGFLSETSSEQMSDDKECKEWFKTFLDEDRLLQARRDTKNQDVCPKSIQEVERLWVCI